MNRREFLKLIGYGIGFSALASWFSFSWNNYQRRMLKPPIDDQPAPKTFVYGLTIEGDEEFTANVENMLRALEEYSPEWYEKLMYAGETIMQISSGATPTAGRSGVIKLPGTASSGGSDDIMRVLGGAETLVHELTHVIDLNTYFLGNYPQGILYHPPGGVRLSVVAELRASIAGDDYAAGVKLFTYLINNEEQIHGAWKDYAKSIKESGSPVDDYYAAYLFDYWYFNDQKEHVVEEEEVGNKYNEILDEIEKIYFDHENKKIKTDFLDESWQEFKEKFPE